MPATEKIESLTANLPDAEAARRFYVEFCERFPAQSKKLFKSEGLLSDVLTIAAFSPLLATTLLQNPEYISWLERQRVSVKVRGKDELLESLARFALTNSNVETNILLARFRRRELLRIYLQDIRGLETIAEITEEISNLADAILEYALRQARQTLENRYGAPLEHDEKGRAKPARFCIVALGKLGSRELNYSSDIDLLFLYSGDGATSGQGERDAITNREYFVKLAETITKIVGSQAGEGAAYRVDLRLRPNGSVGAPAISLNEAINYYKTSARAWERQVLIRSRSAAGDALIFQRFYEAVRATVFSIDETVENALENVRLSKEKINAEKISGENFNVKLGRGGIREIEFIAQALQLAHGGRDRWLQRAPHTLISLSRLADRKLLSEIELTELFESYDFLRSLEHRLQMENGLQTHAVPVDANRRFLIARRMRFETLEEFNGALKKHAENVNRVFERVFRRADKNISDEVSTSVQSFAEIKDAPEFRSPNAPRFASIERDGQSKSLFASVAASLEKAAVDLDKNKFETLEILTKIAPPFAERLAANPDLIKNLPTAKNDFERKDYRRIFRAALETEMTFKDDLAILRRTWAPLLFEIAAFDALEKITLPEAKRAQTALAEASVEAALLITKRELARRLEIEVHDFPFAVLALGKLGGGAMDYGSDLDLILVYEKVSSLKSQVSSENSNLNSPEIKAANAKSGRIELETWGLRLETFYARAAEIFTTALSSLTRDGHLYRVDLRLRPDGKNGAVASERNAFTNYLNERAVVWEWLAYVKLRAVGGDLRLGEAVENETRKIIYGKARQLKIQDANVEILRSETRRVRERLEREKSGTNGKANEVDIKFGAGGMLDVYFAVRFLQLRDDVPDDAANRSTLFTLERLFANNSLSREDFQNFTNGYEFLSRLDHNLRLAVGRSTRIPLGNKDALRTIAQRMKTDSTKDLLERLTVCRLDIRAAFERVLA